MEQSRMFEDWALAGDWENGCSCSGGRTQTHTRWQKKKSRENIMKNYLTSAFGIFFSLSSIK